MIILALDLGTSVGWAIHQHGAVTVSTQEFKIERGESIGLRYFRFGGWLKKVSDSALDRIDLIVYEDPHLRGGYAAQMLMGMVAKVHEFAAINKIATGKLHTATLKKWATGKGNASKEDMVKRAKELGYDVKNDDEADAVLLLRYYMEQGGL